MDSRIFLEIEPRLIEPAAWAEVYDDTLRLLRAHPSQLLAPGSRTVEGVEVQTYTRELERFADDPWRRRWRVVGDRESLGFGGRQVMYRNLERYRRKARGEPATDVLLASDDLVDEWEGGELPDLGEPVRVLGRSTEGKPYHGPLLAAAMVVEARFPRHAAVSGDITPAAARRAGGWAEGVLGRQVPLPVRVEPARLVARLAEHLSGEDLAEAVVRLGCHADETRRTEAALSALPPAAREGWVAGELQRIGSLATREAVDLVVAWLNATGDLARLAELACLDERGPRAAAEELVEALASSWIAVPRELSAQVERIVMPDERPPSFWETLTVLCFDAFVGAAGRKLRYRPEEGRVEADLARAFGRGAARLAALLRKRSAALEAQLREALRENAEQVAAGLDPPVMRTLDTLAAAPSAEGLSEAHRLGVQTFALRWSWEREGRAPGSPDDLRALRERLVLRLVRRRERLTDDVWDWIEGEDDPEVLRFMTFVAGITGGPEGFPEFRRAMLQNRTLCRHAVALSRDEAGTAEAAALLTALGVPMRGGRQPK